MPAVLDEELGLEEEALLLVLLFERPPKKPPKQRNICINFWPTIYRSFTTVSGCVPKDMGMLTRLVGRYFARWSIVVMKVCMNSKQRSVMNTLK